MSANNRLIYAVLAIFFFTFAWLAYSVFVLNQSVIYAENGVLENLQVLTLVFCFLAFLFPLKDSDRQGRLLFCWFSFLCLSFILREVDVEDLDVPTALIAIGSGTGRNLMLAVGFIGMGVYGLFNLAYYKQVARSFVISKAGLLFFIAGVLLYIGGYFENLGFIHHHVFWEEAIELSGYTALLLSALFLFKNRSLAQPDT